MIVTTHSTEYIRVSTGSHDYYLSLHFGWITLGEPFNVASILRDAKLINQVEIAVHTHGEAEHLEMLKQYLKTKEQKLNATSIHNQ